MFRNPCNQDNGTESDSVGYCDAVESVTDRYGDVKLGHIQLKDALSTNKAGVVKLVFTSRNLFSVRSVQSPFCFETSSDSSISLAIVQ